jgi:hypothetical protein
MILFYRYLGVGKDDSSYTYKAKITPASDSEHPSSLASITDVKPLPKSTSEGSNKSQTQDSSSIQTGDTTYGRFNSKLVSPPCKVDDFFPFPDEDI